MEDNVNFFFGNAKRFLRRVEVTSSEIVGYKKSTNPGKENMRIRRQDIAEMCVDRYMLKKYSLYLSVNEETFVLAFDHARDTIEYIQTQYKSAKELA